MTELWIIIFIFIAYTPIIYRTNKRINRIEKQIEILIQEKQDEHKK